MDKKRVKVPLVMDPFIYIWQLTKMQSYMIDHITPVVRKYEGAEVDIVHPDYVEVLVGRLR